jgi:hypothetical protein
VTWLAALEPNHSGIDCRRKQCISAGDDPPTRMEGAELKGPEDERRGWFAVGIGHKTSQESQYEAGQPIQWPNSSWADLRKWAYVAFAFSGETCFGW